MTPQPTPRCDAVARRSGTRCQLPPVGSVPEAAPQRCIRHQPGWVAALHCRARNDQGRRCRQRASDAGWCWAHTPRRTEACPECGAAASRYSPTGRCRPHARAHGEQMWTTPSRHVRCAGEVVDADGARPCANFVTAGSVYCRPHQEMGEFLTGEDAPIVFDVDALDAIIKAEQILAGGLSQRHGTLPAPAPPGGSQEEARRVDRRHDITGASRIADSDQAKALIASARPEQQASLRELLNLSAGLVDHSRAESTQDTYDTALRHFHQWCLDYGVSALPAQPETVMAFLSWLARRGNARTAEDLSRSYLDGIRSAIRAEHLAHGHPSPTDDPRVGRLLTGMSRVHTAIATPAHVVEPEELGLMLRAALQPEAATRATDELAGLLIGSPQVQITGGQLQMWARTTFRSVTFTSPDNPASGAAVLRFLSDKDVPQVIDVQPAADRRICPVAALHGAVLERQIGMNDLSPDSPMLVNGNGEPISRKGLVKNIRQRCEKVGITYRPDGWTTTDLHRWVDSFVSQDPVGVRDAAMLTCTFWAGLRRAEAVGLLVRDATLRPGETERDDILELFVEHSKTDQGRIGATTPLGHGFYGPALSPIVHLWRWLLAYEVERGLTTRVEQATSVAAGRLPGSLLDPAWPLFPVLGNNGRWSPMSGEALNDRFVHWAETVGVEPSWGERLSAHGLRAGQVVTLIDHGVPREAVAKMGRRKTAESIDGYYRSSRLSEVTKPPRTPDQRVDQRPTITDPAI